MSDFLQDFLQREPRVGKLQTDEEIFCRRSNCRDFPPDWEDIDEGALPWPPCIAGDEDGYAHVLCDPYLYDLFDLHLVSMPRTQLLDLLVQVLNWIEKNSNGPLGLPYAPIGTYLTDGQPDDPHPAVRLAVYLADVVLPNGSSVNADAVRVLDDAGFCVFPGETDSFGWLTGVIVTSKGRIVFG